MPELPEVETVRRVLEPHLLKKTITGVQIHNAQVIAAPSPERLVFFIEKNAISFEEYTSTHGKDYRNTPYLQVYGKGGEPCPVCGEALQRIVLGGRSSVFCPHCQK